MSKFSSLLIAGVALGLGFTGSITSASAHHRHHSRGCNCGPTAPSTYYKTIHPVRHVTRVHDISVSRHVTRVHHVTHVTRVQPIIDVQEVTRVHHHTIVHTRTAYSHLTEHLPPIVHVRHAVRNTYDCHCGY